jgi:transcriptional regulator with PAS, ATPase and Fis domain
VIAATNRNLVKLVQEGQMREDFFYRIRILPVRLPPLRERQEDIPLLIDHFLSALTKGSDHPKHLPVRVREAMESYDWPGNVRELQNVLHTYVTLGKLDLMGQITMGAEADVPGPENPAWQGKGLRQRMDILEKRIILGALERTRWHRGKAAQLLQINYKTFQRKIKSHGIK